MKKQVKPLRILAFVDVHGNEDALKILEKKSKNADILICAGDITIFEHRILHLMKKLDRIGKTVLIVHGNHEDPMLLAEICGRRKNVKMLHRKAYSDSRFPEYVFLGHGGEGFTYESPDFERFARSLKRQRLKGKKLVLVTHQPPYGCKVDFVWNHHGNRSYSWFIKKYRPVLHICGHLHETAGRKDKIGKTLVINPGPKGTVVMV